MIPPLKREHVERALHRIDVEGVPPERNSRRFSLVANGRRYPPKYVLSLAVSDAYGRELQPDEFGGGKETNSRLRALGYVIEENIQPGFSELAARDRTAGRLNHPSAKHDERCPSCKDTVFKMLQVLYGRAEKNRRFEAATLPEHYGSSRWHAELKVIFHALARHRGFRDFVKVPNLPNCDFYVPVPGFIVEFDESQHFTDCRRIALEAYPKNLRVAYDREKWISLCESIKSQDNDPPYRDEQRAWYDTLRDFLPSITNLLPTVRLYSRDFQWCNLSPAVPADIEFFRSQIEGQRIQPQ